MLLQNTEFLVTKNPIFVESIALQYFQQKLGLTQRDLKPLFKRSGNS